MKTDGRCSGVFFSWKECHDLIQARRIICFSWWCLWRTCQVQWPDQGPENILLSL